MRTEATGARKPEATGARKPEATGARKPEATSARKPEATSARKPEATSARKPEATRATEVMPPRAAVSAANWAANLGWVITATKLTGIRPIDRSYRRRGGTTACRPGWDGTGTSWVMILECVGWVPAAPSESRWPAAFIGSPARTRDESSAWRPRSESVRRNRAASHVRFPLTSERESEHGHQDAYQQRMPGHRADG